MAWFRKDTSFEDLVNSLLNAPDYPIETIVTHTDLVPSSSSLNKNDLVPSELKGLPLDTIDYRKYRLSRVNRNEIIMIDITMYRGKARL